VAKNEVSWLKEPEPDDYEAAESYLTLLFDESSAAALVRKLKRAPVTEHKATDVFRASALSLLGVSNSHVENYRVKIRKGKKLSPLLLVRAPDQGKVVIADGYHRMCALYTFDEDAHIRCKIVGPAEPSK